MSRSSFGVPHYEYEHLGRDCTTLAAAICSAGAGLGDGFMQGGGSSPDCSRWGPPLGFQAPSPWSPGPEMTSASRPQPTATPIPMLPEERLWLFEFPPSAPPPQHAPPPRHDVYYFPPHEHYCSSPPQPSAPSHGGPCIYHQPPSQWWSSNEYGDGDILFQLQPPRNPMPPPPPPPPTPPPHLLPAPPWASWAWTWSSSSNNGLQVQEPYESVPITSMEDSDVEDDMMYRVERDAPSAPPQSPCSSALSSQRQHKPAPSSTVLERDASSTSRRRSARGGLVSPPTNDTLGFPDEPPTRDSGPAPPSTDPWTLRPRAERPEEDDGQNSRPQVDPSTFTTLFLGCDDKTDIVETRCICNGDVRCGGDTTASCTCGGDPGARMTTFVGGAGAGEGGPTPPPTCLPAAAATTTATTTTLTTAASALTSSVESSPSPSSLPPSAAVAAPTATTTASAPASSSTLTAPVTLPRKIHGFRPVPAEQARVKTRLCMRAL